MKKLGIFIFGMFMLASMLYGRGISQHIKGLSECHALEVSEGSRGDGVICEYFSYWDPSFTCPDGMTKYCYGCRCSFDSGVTIVTRACECN